MLGSERTSDAQNIISIRNIHIVTGVFCLIGGILMLVTPFVSKPIIQKDLFRKSFGISSTIMQLCFAALFFIHILMYPIFGAVDKLHFQGTFTAFTVLFVIECIVEIVGGIIGILAIFSSTILKKMRRSLRFVEAVVQTIVMLISASYLFTQCFLFSSGKKYRASHLIEYYFLTNFMNSMCGNSDDFTACSTQLSNSYLTSIINLMWTIDIATSAGFFVFAFVYSFEIIGFSSFIASAFGEPSVTINLTNDAADSLHNNEDSNEDETDEDDDEDDEGKDEGEGGWNRNSPSLRTQVFEREEDSDATQMNVQSQSDSSMSS
eukprot:MONOS_12107.1-p1 / transcript=MONOS_12107.1 / gene=MONOS_12107 / organism=Monocercomonoides_exilis_PA203 / gene_product=unspecified product / transcript_product=unspecified product / location=Mono_scaffold00646:14491-16071(+) / protein_length=320 / sequence_SO=supercontig / SO=protein_coding / is_pseudo=false